MASPQWETPFWAGGRAGQAVDQGGEPAGRGDRARQVEPVPLPRGLGKHPRREKRGRQPDRHVDEQHPPPGRVGSQQAPGDQADRAAGDAHRGVQAHRPVPGWALGEGGRDQRERGRRDRRRADSLDGAGREQPRLGGGEPASQRSRREQQQPGDEHLTAAKQVPGPARQQQQPAEGQRVGADHPFQAGAGKAQRPLDVRERHVDNGRVQQHHQLRGRDDEQGQAEAGTGCPGPRGTRGSRPPGYGSRLRHEGFSWWVWARYFRAVREAPLACGHLARYERGPWQGATRWWGLGVESSAARPGARQCPWRHWGTVVPRGSGRSDAGLSRTVASPVR